MALRVCITYLVPGISGHFMGELVGWHSWGRKIVCVARNYALHAQELNNPVPKKPFFFLKPPTAYVEEGNPILMPFPSCDLHYEVELGVIIGKTGKNISKEDAYQFIGGYALALDMTARCLQSEAKKAGRPWAEAKGFDTSCPISQFIPKDKISDHQNLSITLSVNGTMQQDGNTNQMIFQVEELIAEASSKWTLERGDILLTGTPHVSKTKTSKNCSHMKLGRRKCQKWRCHHCLFGQYILHDLSSKINNFPRYMHPNPAYSIKWTSCQGLDM